MMEQSKLEKTVAELIRKVERLEKAIEIRDDFNGKMFMGEQEIEIPYWKENEEAQLPIRKKEGDAGYDAYANATVIVKAHSAEKISLGIGIGVPMGFGVHARNRSGNFLGKNYDGQIVIGDAWVDPNYRGIINALVQNTSDKDIEVKTGDRVCSIDLTRTYGIKFVPVEEYCAKHNITVEEYMDTNRGTSGFGNTGLQ